MLGTYPRIRIVETTRKGKRENSFSSSRSSPSFDPVALVIPSPLSPLPLTLNSPCFHFFLRSSVLVRLRLRRCLGRVVDFGVAVGSPCHRVVDDRLFPSSFSRRFRPFATARHEKRPEAGTDTWTKGPDHRGPRWTTFGCGPKRKGERGSQDRLTTRPPPSHHEAITRPPPATTNSNTSDTSDTSDDRWTPAPRQHSTAPTSTPPPTAPPTAPPHHRLSPHTPSRNNTMMAIFCTIFCSFSRFLVFLSFCRFFYFFSLSVSPLPLFPLPSCLLPIQQVRLSSRWRGWTGATSPHALKRKLASSTRRAH